MPTQSSPIPTVQIVTSTVPQLSRTAANGSFRSGNVISASRSKVNLGGIACPMGGAFADEVGGELTATVVGNEIFGEYNQIFGNGANQATFVFSFRATL